VKHERRGKGTAWIEKSYLHVDVNNRLTTDSRLNMGARSARIRRTVATAIDVHHQFKFKGQIKSPGGGAVPPAGNVAPSDLPWVSTKPNFLLEVGSPPIEQNPKIIHRSPSGLFPPAAEDLHAPTWHARVSYDQTKRTLNRPAPAKNKFQGWPTKPEQIDKTTQVWKLDAATPTKSSQDH
jgi:hypothetical protein